MSAAALPAMNTLFQLGTASSPTGYTTIANVSSINGLKLSATIVDVTSHSTGEPWRQKIPTLLDAGDITFDLFLIPDEATHDGTTGILSFFSGRSLMQARLVFPDATTWTFEGYVTGMPMTANVDGVLTANVTFTITGSPTFS